MTAYYNEFDPFAAEWLRNLIKQGLIADGIVDERSIASVEAADLGDFTQCHFFAGIAGWSHALRLAGWPDDRPVWTGSCPCQPFSDAGKKGGTDDERHLWPEQFRLLAECRPDVWFGEQVASKDGLHWLDLVLTDLEAAGYAAGAVDLCAAGLGAPHIRQRLWIVGERLGDAVGAGLEGHAGHGNGAGGWPVEARSTAQAGEPRRLADAEHDQQWQGRGPRGEDPQGYEPRLEPGRRSTAGRMADSIGVGRRASGDGSDGRHDRPQLDADGTDGRMAEKYWRDFRSNADCFYTSTPFSPDRPGPTNGRWRNADWLHCRDGKWRPVEPAVLGLVDGVPGCVVPGGPFVPASFPLAQKQERRTMRLRGYGNAIVPPVAAEFIQSYMEHRDASR